MPWDPTAPSNPKYKTKAHRDERAKLVRQLEAQGYLMCTADVCEFDTRTITNPNGRASDGLHLGHEDDGVTYRGPQHNLCNVRDGARRGSVQSRGTQAWNITGPPQPWLAQDHHPCPACGANVVWASQRCCSKDCAAALARKGPTLRVFSCSLCGATFTGRKRKYCGTACQLEGNARLNRDRYRLAAGLPVDPSRPSTPHEKTPRRWPA